MTSARAIETRMRMPPESSRGKTWPNSSRPTRPSAASTRAAAALPAGVPASLSGSSTLSKTVAHGISVGSWKTKPIRLSLPAGAAACGHSTAPCVGSVSPAMMRKAVDFPQPEGPSSARNSPARTSRSRPASARVPLGNVLPTPRSATSTGRVCSRSPALPLRPQIEPDLLVDELQRVGFTVIEAGLDHARAHHLVEEVPHVRIGHGADAERERVAGIDDAVFLHLGDRVGEKLVAHLRVLLS